MLLASIGIYGLATMAFGLSTSFWLTFTCLAITGAADTVSTVFRNLIRQLETPDGLRGRMTGVNMMFFIGGPQLGELEAGLVAHWVGPVVSVVSGGVGCLLATAWLAPSRPRCSPIGKARSRASWWKGRALMRGHRHRQDESGDRGRANAAFGNFGGDCL